MSVALTWAAEDGLGNDAAQTGNLVHAAAKAFHESCPGDKEAGLAALEAARLSFPDGDPAKARRVFGAYAADPTNRDARVRWCEQRVRLTLAPAPWDVTGEDVVVEGTLDQVRDLDGVLSVWDIKTGSRLDPQESLDEYLIQQVVYVLAARQTLEPSIQPGGLIYTAGYDKARGRRHLPYDLDDEQLRLAATAIVTAVATVRAGVPDFRPGTDACRFCPLKPFRSCTRYLRGHYGATHVRDDDRNREAADDRPGPRDQ